FPSAATLVGTAPHSVCGSRLAVSGRADRWSAAPAAIALQPTVGRLYRIWTHPDSRRPRRWSVRPHPVCGSRRTVSGRADRWSAAPAAIARQPTTVRLYGIFSVGPTLGGTPASR